MPGNLIPEHLIPEHPATSFVMVLFAEYPHQPGTPAEERVLERHFRACRRSLISERHAEPIRGYIHELPPEHRSAVLLSKAYFALAGNARLRPAIRSRLLPAQVRKRNTGEVELG
jgi:hypothetical protein